MSLDLEVEMTIPAKLVVQPDYGKPRLATKEDLDQMGWVHRDDINRRIVQMIEAIGGDPDGHDSLLRHFCEYASGYWGHDLNDADLTDFRPLLSDATEDPA